MGSITADDVEAAANGAAGGTAASIKASPKARKRAEELGVDLTTVEGTGPMDSITADDVEAAATAEPADTGATAGVARADSLRYQQATAVADPAAGAALLETTEAVRSAFEERVTITDVLLVVASAALSDQPLLNGTYVESTHQLATSQDVALVTGVDDGPDTTVVPKVAERSLTDLVDVREQGGAGGRPTFTLANAAAVDAEAPLVNQPGVAALAVDPSGQRAVPTDDGVDLQPLVTASLTYDTRAVDRSDAEAFLDRFFAHVEGASALVLDSYRGSE
jgi:pyruvate dehydrogenase E2 component (dihydrolipoamide acetyltransferase)